jgi:rhamnulokinase
MEKTNQAVPATDGELIRVVLESLALKYRKMLTRLSLLVPALPDTINIVGGGCRNRLLNQMTADATGMRVEAGPVEATAAGNVIAQMIASGDIASLSEGRALLRRSFDLETYEPSFPAAWEAKAKCFDLLLKKS